MTKHLQLPNQCVIARSGATKQSNLVSCGNETILCLHYDEYEEHGFVHGCYKRLD